MDETLHIGTKEMNFENAKRMRRNPTHGESILWAELRNRKLLNYKFRRQHPLSNYIADFYCHELKLVIELDGEYHTNDDVKQQDKKRTEHLREFDITVYRLTNQELNNCSLAMEKLRQFIEALPSPSP
jgi:very-short-patch-repair endonuclease